MVLTLVIGYLVSNLIVFLASLHALDSASQKIPLADSVAIAMVWPIFGAKRIRKVLANDYSVR